MSTGFISLGIGALLLLILLIDGITAFDIFKAKFRIPVGIVGFMVLSYGIYSTFLGDTKESNPIESSQLIDPTQLVVVTSPVDGDSVKCRILTEGTCPASYDKFIWVLLRPADGKYYPQSDHTSNTYVRNGEWQVITRLGGRRGEIFELNVFEADTLASEFFSATLEDWKDALSYPGLTDSELPEGARLVERISVPLSEDCRGVF